MIYLICFFISLTILLFVMANEKAMDLNFILLIVVVAIGNGGYFARAISKNLEEAILANTLTYVIGIFAPMLIFLIISGICQVHIPKVLSVAMYALQILLYLGVCTVGHFDLFYRSVEYHADPAGAYLTKTYGPLHTVYLITLLLYTIAGMAVGIYSLSRKTSVSRVNVDTVIIIDALAVGIYMLERFIQIKMELMPIVFVATLGVMLYLLTKVYTYSIYANQHIFETRMKQNGFIVFDKTLRYMGSNDRAKELFPELSLWELEVKIPGSGGRFNTFLRPDLLSFVSEGASASISTGTYEYKGEKYRYEMGTICAHSGRVRGYTVMIGNEENI